MTRGRVDREALRRWWQRVRPMLWEPGRWAAAVRHNFVLKALSVVAAFSLWLFVNAGARETEQSLQVPLELRNIPTHLMIISPRVDFVDLRVSGPRTILGRIERGRLSVPLDLAGVRPGPAVFRIAPEFVNLPRGAKIVRINPSQVTLELARVGRKTVPVRLLLKGDAPDGLVVGATKIAPQSVEVVGPAPDVEEIKFVETEPVEVTGDDAGPQQVEAGLQVPGEYFSLSAERVAVELRLDEQVGKKEFKRAVQVRGAAYAHTLKPQEVRITLRGPKRLLAALELPADAVYIDASNEEPGVYLVSPIVDVPRGAEVVEQAPARLRLELLKDRPRR